MYQRQLDPGQEGKRAAQRRPASSRLQPTAEPDEQAQQGLAPSGARLQVLQGRFGNGYVQRVVQRLPTNRDQDPGSRGGSYNDMRKLSQLGVREADHTPPKSTYEGTPYAWVTEGQMPAISIPYVVHRGGQGGAGGGVTTTGSHAIIARYRDDHIRAFLIQNDFMNAMIVALNDQKNAAPNTEYLERGQIEAAEYACQIGLLADDEQLARVIEAIIRITY